MTATRDRRHDPRAEVGDVDEWGRRSVFGRAPGWPWWAAVLLALGLSIIGGFIDMKTSDDLGKVFEGAYFLGCVAAVCLVRRRNVFGPMVQAPLILAVSIPVVVLLTKGLPPSGGTISKLIALGVPLVTGFPVMAITTGATVVIGGVRYVTQRKPVGADTEPGSARAEVKRRPADRDDERGDRLSSRPRSGSTSGRSRSGSTAGRPDRGDRDAVKERGRTSSSSSRSRSEAPDRASRSAGGSRSSGQSRDRDKDRGRDSSQPRERGQSADRDRPSRSGQSRDRGSNPRGAARDDGRRQPPRRRDDDDR